MTRLKLSLALTPNHYNRPFFNGQASVQGVELNATSLPPSELYWRQLRFREFDASELSIASLFIARAKGDLSWTALPIFTMRRFFHTRILVRKGSGIRTPADLRGKRVGVPEYQQTAAVWCRGVLQHEFNVHPREVEWYMERGVDRSHGGATGFTVPDGIRLNTIASASSIGSMLCDGSLDATLLFINERNLVDRSSSGNEVLAATEPLFADADEEGRRFYAKTGVYPINHTVVVRTELLERHPWLALNLQAAFAATRQDILRIRHDTAAQLYETGALDRAALKALGWDLFPYGMKAAAREIGLIAQYLHEQGLTERVLKAEEVFWPSTLEL